MRSALEYAHGEAAVPSLPSGRFPALHAARREARILQPRGAASQLLASLSPGGRAGPAIGILLCLYTGMRLGEACGLRWGDISPDCNMYIYKAERSNAYLTRTVEHKTALVLDTPKSQSSMRAIPVPARLCPVLERARQGDGCYVLTGTEAPMEPRRFQSRFKAALRAARCVGYKLSRSTPHICDKLRQLRLRCRYTCAYPGTLRRSYHAATLTFTPPLRPCAPSWTRTPKAHENNARFLS